MSLGLLALGSLLGGGGGGSQSSSNSQTTNTIAFNPAINIGGGVTGPSGNASAQPRSTVVTDQEPGGATIPSLTGSGFSDEYRGTPTVNASGDIFPGIPNVALIGAAGLAVYFLFLK